VGRLDLALGDEDERFGFPRDGIALVAAVDRRQPRALAGEREDDPVENLQGVAAALVAPPLSGAEYRERLSQRSAIQRGLLGRPNDTKGGEILDIGGFPLSEKFLTEVEGLRVDSSSVPPPARERRAP